jgi:uncharacterized DUF497 family protein
MKQLTEFDWDNGNIDKNLKHGVEFRECEEVFSNPPVKIFDDKKHSKTEMKYMAYGVTNKNRKLTVVFTVRRGKIRVISARDQNRKERRVYEQEKIAETDS